MRITEGIEDKRECRGESEERMEGVWGANVNHEVRERDWMG